jgi:predicted phage tail protein
MMGKQERKLSRAMSRAERLQDAEDALVKTSTPVALATGGVLASKAFVALKLWGDGILGVAALAASGAVGYGVVMAAAGVVAILLRRQKKEEIKRMLELGADREVLCAHFGLKARPLLPARTLEDESSE